MNRLNFVLPEWTRVAWSSQTAREVWEPRVRRIVAAWEAVERAAVAAGAKPSALQNVAPEALPEVSAEASRLGLVALPMGRVAAGRAYNASAQPAGAGPWAYRVVFTTPTLAADWGDAWAHSDNDAIGRLLGFPSCCRAFFARHWVEQRRVDLTYAATADRGGDVSGPPEANILGRWMGVRLVSHMPCAFDCQASAEVGRALHRVFLEQDAEAASWCREMLSWPAEWTALHGIAEVKTPVWRVSTRTDATADLIAVRYRGTHYPAEGASGNMFPFQRQPQVVPLTSLRSYTRAFEGDAEWRENGFSSRAAMVAAHKVVASCAPGEPSVLDLGCGNGRLARLVAGTSWAWGIDRTAPSRHELNGFEQASIEQVDVWKGWDVDLTILMPGRLLEMSAKQSADVRHALRGRRVLLYAYGDWLTEDEPHRGLLELARRARLNVRVVKACSGDGAAAALVEVN